jgi:hypothetical protein
MARRYDPNQPRVPEGLPGAGQWRGLNLAQRLVGEWRGPSVAQASASPQGGISASSVSRDLAALGVRPLPSGTSRMREGVRVTGSLGTVRVSVDLDSENMARRRADDIEEALRGKGYTVERASEQAVVVRGRATEARPSSPQTPARSGDVLAERLRGEMSEAASAPSAAWTPGRKPEFTGSVERRGSQYIFTVRANGQVVSTRRSARRYAYANVHMDGTVKYSWAMDTRGTVHPVPLEGADKPDRQQATRDTWVVTFADGGTAEVELEQSLSTPAFMSARQKFPGRQVMRVTRKR